MTIINQAEPPKLYKRQSSFLKWAGGKFNALNHILPHFPDLSAKTFVEPFAGSGTVGLNVTAQAYWLNDFNKDLVSIYNEVIAHPERTISFTKKLWAGRNTREAYNDIRERFNDTDVATFRAYLFLYLNRHAFNGICRYNSKGGFNVPFGKYTSPVLPEKDIRNFAKHFSSTKVTNLSFEEVMRNATPNSVVYCDPPYVPLSATAMFSDYTSDGFSAAQQQLLADLALELKNKGIPVFVSNHDTPTTQKMYASCDKYIIFPVSRTISSKTSNRTPVNEVLACWLP